MSTSDFQSLSPEVTIFLYDDEQKLVHMKLIEMGLADLEEWNVSTVKKNYGFVLSWRALFQNLEAKV